MEDLWPTPSDEKISIFCKLKILDAYDIAKLVRLKKIVRPSDQARQNYNQTMNGYQQL